MSDDKKPAADTTVGGVLVAAGSNPSLSPLKRYHPVFGERTFEDANEFAAAGGEDGDWRFKSAGAADQARTQPEAELAAAYNLRRKMELIDGAGHHPVGNSAEAYGNARAGIPEYGVPLAKPHQEEADKAKAEAAKAAADAPAS